MDHEEAVRQKATERYLLDELDPEGRDQFEEHMFDCQDCAMDVRAAAMFVEQTKVVLAEKPVAVPLRVAAPAPARAGWFAWFRPAFAVPVLAVLLAVIGYQNFVTYPKLMQAANDPQPGPWVSVTVDTRSGPGDTAPILAKRRAGEALVMVVNLPPKDGLASPGLTSTAANLGQKKEEYTSFTADLYNPAGKREWSGAISTASTGERRQITIPGSNRQSGTYTLVVHGITASGESKEVSHQSIDVQTQ